MELVAPLTELVQAAGEKLRLSCNTKPAVAGVHDTVAWVGSVVVFEAGFAELAH